MKSIPLLALTVFALAFQHSGAAAEEPNIVVFLVDDMGPMDTSIPMLADAEGNPQRHPLNDWYRTPNMERLAERGIRFSTFYAQSTCSPTRISIMTGQNATRHRTTAWIRPENDNGGTFGPPEWNWKGLHKDAITLPGVLRDNGYRTIFVGKAHFGPIGGSGEFPQNLGFDVNIAGCSYGQPGSYYGEDGYGNLNPKRQKRAVPGLEKYHETDTYLSEVLTLEATAEVDKAIDSGKPFFLYLSHYAVHSPFHSDPRFADNYSDSDKPKNAQAYATMIEGMDKSLGDVLDHLESKGVAENTLVFFLGDNGSDAPLGSTHGYASSAPLRGKKATCYEGGTRTPFIAAWAKPDATNQWQKRMPVSRGAMQTQIGTVMDLYPTILELAGIDNPVDHPIDGFSLRTQLAGEASSGRPDFFLSHFPHRHRSSYFTSLRKGDWKVIYRYLPGPESGKRNPQGDPRVRYELFNLARDPYETTNLAETESDQLKKMMLALLAQLEAENALFPVDAEGKELRPIMP